MSVYVGAPLCPEAKRGLAKNGAQAGDVRVRVECLGPSQRKGKLDLAAIGADARRTVEDSSSVAFVAPPGPAVSFARPILEEPEIATIIASSGATGLSTVLNTLDARDSNESPRESVWAARGHPSPPS